MRAGTKAVLLTGFEPFGGETVNPSELAARALDGRIVEGRTVTSLVLPCRFDHAATTLIDAIGALHPELVISTGQAGGRREIAVERVALNVNDATIADNAGQQPIDAPIATGGPVGYWSTLPIKAIVAALRARSIPAAVSQTAGTFVCNHAFYTLMHTLEGRPGVRGGFIHVPWLPEQAERAGRGAPSLPLETIVLALETAIATALRTGEDLHVAGGATH